MNTWLGRFVRGRRPDRNPLRRASDLVETAVLAILVIAFAVGAPFAARGSAAWAHARAHQAQLEQEASWQQVTARLLATAPGSMEGGWGGPIDPETQARWTAPDGRVMTGEVPVVPGAAAGTTVRIWVTRDGQPTSQPLQDSQVAGQATLAGMLGVVALGFLLTITGALVRHVLNNRRMAAWAADWRATGPRWTARR
jgi:hypothetical protein